MIIILYITVISLAILGSVIIIIAIADGLQGTSGPFDAMNKFFFKKVKPKLKIMKFGDSYKVYRKHGLSCWTPIKPYGYAKDDKGAYSKQDAYSIFEDAQIKLETQFPKNWKEVKHPTETLLGQTLMKDSKQ